MDALTAARVNAERSYANAIHAVKQASVAASAQIGGMLGGSQDRQQLSSGGAAEQLSHFRGWVFAAIRPIAQRIAGQPICVARVAQRRVPGAKSFQLKSALPSGFKSLSDQLEPIDDHPLLSLLSDPNELMVAWSLVYTLVASLELTGRGFWWIPHPGLVLPIPTSWILGYTGKSTYETWLVQPPGAAEPKPIPSSEMVYFNYPHPSDPRASCSPLQAAAMAVETDESLQASQRRAFKHGIMPKTILKVGRLKDSPGAGRPVLTGEQRTQLITAIKSAYAASSKWEEPLILDGLIDEVDTLGRTIAEMDFLQSGEQTKARIFQVFGTNPIIAGEIQNANRASATVAEEHFCSFTVNPKITLLSQCLTEWLGPMFARPGERLIVYIEEAQPHDAELSAKQWQFALSRGTVTDNEYRRNQLGLSDHPDGDELRRPTAPARPPAAADAGEPATDKGINPYTLRQFANGDHK